MQIDPRHLEMMRQIQSRRALLRATAVGLCLMATLCAAGGVLLLSVAAQHEASAGGMLKLLKAT